MYMYVGLFPGVGDQSLMCMRVPYHSRAQEEGQVRSCWLFAVWECTCTCNFLEQPLRVVVQPSQSFQLHLKQVKGTSFEATRYSDHLQHVCIHVHVQGILCAPLFVCVCVWVWVCGVGVWVCVWVCGCVGVCGVSSDTHYMQFSSQYFLACSPSDPCLTAWTSDLSLHDKHVLQNN